MFLSDKLEKFIEEYEDKLPDEVLDMISNFATEACMLEDDLENYKEMIEIEKESREESYYDNW